MAAKKKQQSVERTPRPLVYEYHDYRELLKDWFEYLCGSNMISSIRQLSRDAGIASGYLPMVLKGDRKLTTKAMHKLEPLIHMTSTELSYLTCLSILSDSDDQEERLSALKKMQRFRKYKNKNISEVQAYKLLTKWYYVALREMADLAGIKFDSDEIKNRLLFKIDKKEIREAVRFLSENEHIEMNENGEVQLKEQQLDCVGSIYKIGLTQFHKEMFKLAAKSIDIVASEDRSILGHTLAISHKRVPELKQILDDALEKVTKLASSKEDHDMVYHTGFLAFPLTKPIASGETGGES